MSEAPVVFRQRVNEAGRAEIYCVKCQRGEDFSSKQHPRPKVRYVWAKNHAADKHNGTAIYL